MSGLDRAFFSNSGTEAIEGALKMVHSHGRAMHPEKYEIISLENSFHGRSMGALSITGQPKYRRDFEPLIPGVKFVPANDVAALEAAFSDRTAGIVMEMIQGEGGIYPLTHEFVARARELADRHNALLVADETQCGVGRPGTYFAYQRSQPVILPDVVVAAKPRGLRHPAGLHPGQRKGRGGHQAGHARHHLRRRTAGLPRGAGIPGHSGRAAALHPARRRILPREAQ